MPRNDEVARLLGSDYGEVLWEPGTEVIEQARITQYLRWLAEHHGVAAADYQDLWEWSVGDPGAFWDSLWEYFGVLGQRGDGPALSGQMPEASWFPGATLNYARNALRTARTDPGRVAIIACAEDTPPRTYTYGELAAEVGRVRGALRALGVKQGDRVAAFLPNIPEAFIGLLAAASLGAIWSSCSPDFGAHSVIDRFAQISPTVLFAVGGYRYGGKDFSRDEAVSQIVAGLPGLAALIMVDSPDAAAQEAASPRLGPATRAAADAAGVRTFSFADLPAAAGDGQPEFVEVPFDHPLWVLYSSGTTGLPKAIMHGHGGIVLEHLKALGLQQDLGPGDVFFWYTTTGWMMWNYLAGGLLAGTTIVLYDGSATYPGTDAAAARGLPLGLLRRQRGRAARLVLRRHRRVHRVRRAEPAAAGTRGPHRRPVPGGQGGSLRRHREAGHGGGRRARHHRADAVHAGRLLERSGPREVPGQLLRRLSWNLAAR